MSVAFELQDSIDNMLEQLGTGYGTVFGDMSYQYDRYVGLLGKLKQSRGTLPHLSNTAR